MSYTELGGLVLGTELVAAFTCALLHRIVHPDRFRRYHEVGYAVFLQLGVIFAVLLAFVFNGVWSDYNTASPYSMRIRNLGIGFSFLILPMP
jgi:hypothetical protein